MVVIALFVLVACAPSFQHTFSTDERVQVFLTVFPDAKYAEARYDANEAAALRDVLARDCPGIAPREMVRATFTGEGATLIVYADPRTREIFCTNSQVNETVFTVKHGDPASVPEGTLFTVNGESITEEQLAKAVAQLPQSVQDEQELGAVVVQLINSVLLRQAAATTQVPEEELDAAVRRVWEGAGYKDEESFRKDWEAQGESFTALRATVLEALRIQRFLEENGVYEAPVSEDELKELYLANIERFLVGEQVRFRQLFIAKRDNRSAAEQRMRAALAAIRQGGDFCELVREWSDDTSSRNRCGEYLAPRGVMAPDIENALFSLAENQTTVIESASGFHFFVVLERKDAGIIPFADAAPFLRDAVSSQAAQERLSLLLLKLRAKAEIVDYS